MERPPEYATHDSKLGLFPGGSSFQDPDVREDFSSPAWISTYQKRKRSQVVPHDVIEIDGDDDPDGVVIIDESTSDYKNKQPMSYHKDWQQHVKEALTNCPVGSSSNPNSKNYSLLGVLKSSETVSLDYNFSDEDEYSECDHDVDVFEENEFNEMDLSLGVEVAVPWLQPTLEGSRVSKQKIVIGDEIDVKYKSFKQFDTVQDHSDHYFSKPELLKRLAAVKKPAKDWSNRIQNEWKILEKDLPEMIYVRIYEDRMDILRAVMIGPAGTPYHDGLFFFDVYFPPGYPFDPPMVHYHSGGLRLNPNLYECGKVCLSLLNTWSGSGCEKWNPSKSTMLQVLVSIQALVLNAKPYFNEPGFAQTANTPYGEKESLAYNENIFLLSCKTMLYSLRKPPRHFEDFVAGHFRKYGRAILVACKAYMDGAQVGCVVGNGVQDVDEGDKSCSSAFKTSLKHLFENLLTEFTIKGADCDEFLAQNVEDGAAKAADTTLKL